MYWFALPLYFLLLAFFVAGILFLISSNILVSVIASVFILLIGFLVVGLFPPRAY